MPVTQSNPGPMDATSTCPLCGDDVGVRFGVTPDSQNTIQYIGCFKCGFNTQTPLGSHPGETAAIWQRIWRWHVCRNCARPPYQHNNKKCLFNSTTYIPTGFDGLELISWGPGEKQEWLSMYQGYLRSTIREEMDDPETR